MEEIPGTSQPDLRWDATELSSDDEGDDSDVVSGNASRLTERLEKFKLRITKTIVAAAVSANSGSSNCDYSHDIFAFNSSTGAVVGPRSIQRNVTNTPAIDAPGSGRNGNNNETKRSDRAGCSHVVAITRTNNSKRKPSREPPEDDSDTENTTNGKKKRSKTMISTRPRLLACPFHQHAPNSYKKGACSGPGFATVALL